MPVIDADGCPIHVEVEGPERAPVLMLSNSLGTTLHMWDGQVAPFTRHFRLVRYDRRGHGKSGVPKGPYTMERLGRDVARRARRARHQEGQLVRPLHGRHGRPMARRQRARAHRADGPHQHVELFPGQERLERAPEAGARRKALRPSPRPTWRAGSPRVSCEREPQAVAHDPGDVRRDRRSKAISPAAQRCATWTTAHCCREIKAPTLVIAGKHDGATPPEANEYISSHIPGAKFALLDAAHLSNVEQPQAYTDAVLGFLLAG